MEAYTYNLKETTEISKTYNVEMELEEFDAHTTNKMQKRQR